MNERAWSIFFNRIVIFIIDRLALNKGHEYRKTIRNRWYVKWYIIFHCCSIPFSSLHKSCIRIIYDFFLYLFIIYYTNSSFYFWLTCVNYFWDVSLLKKKFEIIASNNNVEKKLINKVIKPIYAIILFVYMVIFIEINIEQKLIHRSIYDFYNLRRMNTLKTTRG